MREDNIPVPMSWEMFRELSETVGSCRDLAFQLRKDYIYNKCVELQKKLDEFLKSFPQEELPEED